MGSPLAGVLVLDKPPGPTSHDVVARIRRLLGTREVGHAGTLDPMATGVLVVAVGEATKLVPWLSAERKAYRTTIALGVETNTLDAVGTVVQRLDVGGKLRAALEHGAGSPALEEAVGRERARPRQVPPSFSAVHTAGERAYAKARRGEAVELEARAVEVHTMAIVAATADPPSLTLELEVSKGYYVRALARDLAQGLGTVGHLTALQRTRSGTFLLVEATAGDAPHELATRLLPIAVAAARVLPVARLSWLGAEHARRGREVPATEIRANQVPCAASAWLDERGSLVAVGELDAAGRGRVVRGFSAQGT